MREIHFKKIIEYLLAGLPYLRITVAYVAASLFFGFLIGIIIAKLNMSKHKLPKAIGRIYITLTRCTPPLVLLFLTFYGLPTVLRNNGFHIGKVEPLAFVCLTFSIFVGSSSSEIIRSAIEVVGKSQKEAAYAVGLSEFQAFILIILPQMFKVALPNIGNTIIYLFKEGSLAYTIGLHDVLGHVLFTSSGERDLYLLEAYLALTLIYWPISVIIQKLFTSLEKKFQYKRKEERKVKNKEEHKAEINAESKEEITEERKEENENRLGLRAGSIS
ncbi:MAG: amino acid ABC transporter permease [Eubacterium sp.]|nr:amino acid ABC transporter permease [Eubacterium sp.]